MDCTEYIITNKRFFKGPREEKLKSLEGLIKRKVKVISYCVRNYHKTVAFFFSFLFFWLGLQDLNSKARDQPAPQVEAESQPLEHQRISKT